MIHPTKRSITSPNALKKRTNGSRASGALRAVASATRKVKTISDTMLPLAAASTGLAGMSDVNHSTTPTGVPLACTCAAASAAPGGSGMAPVGHGKSATTAGIVTAGTTALTTRRAKKTRSVRPPNRPTARRSDTDATPVMRSETTSGMTVMRIALTHSVPMGWMAVAHRANCSFPDAAIALPNARPAMRAASTTTPSLPRRRVVVVMRARGERGG